MSLCGWCNMVSVCEGRLPSICQDCDPPRPPESLDFVICSQCSKPLNAIWVTNADGDKVAQWYCVSCASQKVEEPTT